MAKRERMSKQEQVDDWLSLMAKLHPEAKPTGLFTLFQECSKDYCKLYDRLSKLTASALRTMCKVHKLTPGEDMAEQLVLYVHNSKHSWSDQRYAESYSREGDFFVYKDKPEPEPEPEPKPADDDAFYVKTCTVDWDCIILDMSQVDLKRAAELVRLANRTKTGIPVSIPVLIEYDATVDTRSRWRVVANHTHCYAAIKLAKLWGSKDCTIEWGKQKPCEASGMVRCNVLNCCSVGTGLGKEQPSQQYIDDVLAMLC
jgi:hypothetical protein